MWSAVELELLAKVAREHDLIVITDEIYESITYGEAEHISPATVADLGERSVTIMGLLQNTGNNHGQVSPHLLACRRQCHY